MDQHVLRSSMMPKYDNRQSETRMVTEATNRQNLNRLITSSAVLRIRDVYPGSRIQQQKRGVKKFHKIVNSYIFSMLKKNFGPVFKEL
jgi:hypothetical protein